MIPGPDGTVALAGGRLRIEGGTITELHLGGCADAAAETLICPGFVDAHLHLPQFDSVGVGGLELLTWLDRVIFPAETRWADPAFAGAMAQRVAERLLSFGTVGIAAYATVHRDGTAAAAHACAEAGLWGCVGQVLMDRAPYAPPSLCRGTAQLLAEAASHASVGRIEPAVTPRFAVCCTEELLHGAGNLARETGWAVQTHLAETRAELGVIAGLYPGRTYTGVYGDAGLLTARALLGHGIHLDDADRAQIAAAGAVVAHCPTANLFLRAGEMDLGAHVRARVRVAMGSDVAGGPDVSMVRVARAMLDTCRRVRSAGEPVPSAAEAWWMITGGNAAAMGREGHAVLRAGAPADVVVVGPDAGWRSHPDPLSLLVHAWDDRWIRRTIAAGRVVYGE